MNEALNLASYRLLGRSGLRVSPLSLGTMTFGEPWGPDAAEARRIFDAYVDLGGNFIDTAARYADGRSESIVGEFAGERRDRLVLATKYSFAAIPGDPNSGGNHRKSMMQGIEQSLRRLNTDYIDLFYLHVWDGTTPGDEVMRAIDDAVRQGKILYAGISDTPAWQVARMQTIADLRGWTPFVALQVEYNLIERTAERDLIPAARDLGLGVLPWSPLAGGILSGKYGSAAAVEGDSARRAMLNAHGKVTERAIDIADALHRVAGEVGISPAQVAIAWTLVNPGVTSPIIGARTFAQFQDNIAAVEVVLTADQIGALNAASAFALGFPHEFAQQPFIRMGLTGGTSIRQRM